MSRQDHLLPTGERAAMAGRSQDLDARALERSGQLPAGLAESMGRAAGSDEAAVRRRRVAAILRAVENQVVPRLLSAHGRRPALPPLAAAPPPSDRLPDAGGSGGQGAGGGGASGVANAGVPVTREAVLALAAALLGPEPGPAAAACVARCRADGVSIEAICLDLLSEAARYLGDLWVDDRCSFTEVTLAAVQLHRLLHDLAPGGAYGATLADGGLDRPGDGRSDGDAAARAGLALLVAAPGEQHSLGLSMLSDFFRGAGWQVQNPAVTNAADAARVVAARPVDLIGFSLGAEVHMPRLALCIAAVRRASRNRDIIVMVGGPAFLERPELAIRVGADDTARDASEAVARAAGLLAARRRPAAGRRASTARTR